jgi:predicted transcriptional regulator of viral defense system
MNHRITEQKRTPNAFLKFEYLRSAAFTTIKEKYGLNDIELRLLLAGQYVDRRTASTFSVKDLEDTFPQTGLRVAFRAIKSLTDKGLFSKIDRGVYTITEDGKQMVRIYGRAFGSLIE